MRPNRRLVALLLVLALLVAVGWTAGTGPTADAGPPVAAGTRSPPSVTFRRPAPATSPADAPSPADDGGAAPSPEPIVEDDDDDAETVIDLFDLPPETLEPLVSTAGDRLHALVEACEQHAPAPLDLVCLLTIDADGLRELEVRPTVLDADTILVDATATLPEALVDCLGDALWDQDWTGTVGSVAPGTAVKMGLSMDLRPERSAELATDER